MAFPNSPVVPAGSQIVGTSSTLNVAGSNIIPQVANRIVNYGDKSRPIFSVMAKLSLIEDAHNTTYQWDEIQYDEPSVNCETVIAAAAAGATQANVVLDTLAAVPGDQFEEAATNQLFEITAVTAQDTVNITSTVTLKKMPSTSAILVTTANSMFLRMGNTMLDGGRFADPKTKMPLRLSNNITQISEQVSVTKLMETQWLYGGMSTFEMQLNNAQDQLNHNIERRLIFGKQYQETVSINRSQGAETGIGRGSRGIWDTIQTKRVQYSSNITEAGLDDFCATYMFGDVFGGGDMKLCFSGNLVFSDIAGFVKNKFRKLDSSGQYGLTLYEYTSPVGNGSLYFVEERQFFNTPAYKNTILALDPAFFTLMRVYEALLMVQDTSPKDRTVKSLGIEAAFGPKLMAERFHGIYSHTV